MMASGVTRPPLRNASVLPEKMLRGGTFCTSAFTVVSNRSINEHRQVLHDRRLNTGSLEKQLPDAAVKLGPLIIVGLSVEEALLPQKLAFRHEPSRRPSDYDSGS